VTISTALNAQGLAHSFLPRHLSPELQALADLALDLRWIWSHGTDHLWQALDRNAWEITSNPWSILQTISQDRLEELARDQNFLEQLNQAQRERIGTSAIPDGMVGPTLAARSPSHTSAWSSAWARR